MKIYAKYNIFCAHKKMNRQIPFFRERPLRAPDTPNDCRGAKSNTGETRRRYPGFDKDVDVGRGAANDITKWVEIKYGETREDIEADKEARPQPWMW